MQQTNMLFEHWHPVTRDLGLVNAPVDACVESFTSWQSSIGLQYTIKTAVSFSETLGLLPPLSAEKRRLAFVPTAAPGWTALFQSGISGSDPFPATSMLASNLLRTLGMRVCVTPPAGNWPAVLWEVYAPKELGGDSTLGYRRAISAMNDGGRWVFNQSGEPYPFEEVAKYTLPRKRDRFTREMLIDYLAQFGLAPLSDAFYSVSGDRRAVVLERTSRWNNPPPEFTLEQVVAGVPWRQS
jgi:hypothetical protein